MKKKVSFKHLTAIVFVIILAVNFLMGLYPFALGSYRMLRGILRGKQMGVSTIEYTFNDSFPAKGILITVNGGIQRLMGARHLNERYLLDNGHLSYTIEAYDTAMIADKTVEFSRTLEEMGIPMVYVNIPFQINARDKQLPVGVEDHGNENADAFLSRLRENNVSVLDLRQSMEQEGLDHYSMFFRTDHHWTAEGGFWGFTRMVDYLTGMDSSFAVDPRITDLGEYQLTVLENTFLGSAGRRVGSLYAGKDDLTLIEPGFETQLRFVVELEDVERVGSYQQTILFPENLVNSDDFNSSKYNVYCNGDYDKLEITNTAGDAGMQVAPTGKRVLVLKDSFSSVLIPFLALSYEQTCFVDLRYYEGSLMELIHQFQPDAVMVAYNVGAMEVHNENMYEFMK